MMWESIALFYKLGVHVFDMWTLCPYLDKIFICEGAFHNKFVSMSVAIGLAK